MLEVLLLTSASHDIYICPSIPQIAVVNDSSTSRGLGSQRHVILLHTLPPGGCDIWKMLRIARLQICNDGLHKYNSAVIMRFGIRRLTLQSVWTATRMPFMTYLFERRLGGRLLSRLLKKRVLGADYRIERHNNQFALSVPKALFTISSCACMFAQFVVWFFMRLTNACWNVSMLSTQLMI